MMVFLSKIFLYFSLLQKGIIIKTAKCDEDLTDVYRFRWKIYLQEQYIEDNDYPNKELQDKYDQFSIHFLAIKKKKIIGAVRLVLFSPLSFPTKNAFNLAETIFHEEKTAELSKLCVEKNYRGTAVTISLLKKAYDYSKNKDIQFWIMGMPSSLKDHFEKLNIRFEQIPIKNTTKENMEERKTASKYFGKTNIQPYLLKITRKSIL